jgi:hypothetical protein
LLENMKGREQVEDLDVDGDSSKFDMKKGWDNVNWILLAQDRNQGWALMGTVKSAGSP